MRCARRAAGVALPSTARPPAAGGCHTDIPAPPSWQIDGVTAAFQLVLALNCTHQTPYPHADTAEFAANVTLAPDEQDVVVRWLGCIPRAGWPWERRGDGPQQRGMFPRGVAQRLLCQPPPLGPSLSNPHSACRASCRQSLMLKLLWTSRITPR